MIRALHLDLSQFKLINDTLGEQTGDQVLHLVADRLSDVIDNKDSVYRVGGNEYVILSPVVSGKDDIEEKVEEISQAISEIRACLCRVDSVSFRARI